MENDYFQNGNIKHNYNIIDPNQELMWQDQGKVGLYSTLGCL